MVTCINHSSTDAVYIEFGQIESILASAADSGVQIDHVLTQIGLPGGLNGTDAKAKLRLSDYFRLQRDIARSLDDLTAHLSERKLTYQTGHFVLEQMKRSATLQDAIRCMAEYFNMMHGDAYNLVRYTGDKLTLVIDDATFPYTFRSDGDLTNFVGDMLLIKIHCLLDSISQGLANRALRKVGVLRHRDEDDRSQVGFWSVPVHYKRPAYELVYDYDMACQNIPSPTSIDLSAEGIFARVIGYLDALQPSADTRTYALKVRDLIAGGCEAQTEVAAQLQVSVATLRRRLSEEKISFRQLLHEAKFVRAVGLLTKGASVSQVSEQLGYSDIRAFNRAFKNWKGQTPAAYARNSNA